MGTDVVYLAVEGVFVILWWLLRQKSHSQEEQIKLLFEKHDEDATALAELKIRIASEHYVKGELDTKFDRLESTFRGGFSDLGDKFERLSNALIKHMSRDDR